ncbi:MAG: hypothetical protein RMJ31_03820 [Nitrososphaerota archaeon]|nr:hypothetical protein [Nitrososphaerales archaeon]MDW8044885.1 hypothetical protein [Nitrososphaerota archaeon]
MELKDLILRLRDLCAQFYQNCPYFDEERLRMNYEIFKEHFVKERVSIFYRCGNPESSYKCISIIFNIGKVIREIEFKYPSIVRDATIDYYESKGMKGVGMSIGAEQLLRELATTFCDTFPSIVDRASHLVEIIMKRYR